MQCFGASEVFADISWLSGLRINRGVTSNSFNRFSQAQSLINFDLLESQTRRRSDSNPDNGCRKPLLLVKLICWRPHSHMTTVPEKLT